MSNHIAYHSRTTCELRLGCNFDDCKKHTAELIKLNDHESGLGEFSVMFCSKCQLGFTEPYPTEDTSGYLYESKNSSDFDLVNDSFVDKIKDLLSFRLLKKIAPHSNIKKVLDYSTGNGRFALSASEAFPLAIIDAIDYQKSPPMLIAKSNKTNLNYINVNDISESNNLYDLIILRHVLEHSYHPISLIKDLSQRLAIDGVLYIEVPNLNSGCARIFGKYWKLYYVPRHIFHFTKSSLQEVIEKAGMTAVIEGNEIPLMGNTISIITGLKQDNLFVQLLGILFHPFQLVIEFFFQSSSCINAKCKKLN